MIIHLRSSPGDVLVMTFRHRPVVLSCVQATKPCFGVFPPGKVTWLANVLFKPDWLNHAGRFCAWCAGVCCSWCLGDDKSTRALA
jgi:hypothetical protein